MNNSVFFKILTFSIFFLIFWSLRDFFLLIICSLVIANIVCNLTSKLKNIVKIPRSFSLLLVLIFLSFIFLTSVLLVLPPFIKEVNEILVDVPNILTRINFIFNSNLDKINRLLYGNDVENIFSTYKIFNDLLILPDGATIAKAIQEGLINVINLAGNLGSGLVRIIFVLVVSLMIL